MEDSSPIQRMAGDCRDYLQRCVDRFNATDTPDTEELKLITKEYQRRFNAWASYLCVFANNESSLDYRLRNHTALQDMNIRLLDMLRENIFLISELEIPEAKELPTTRREVDEMRDHTAVDKPPLIFNEEFLGVEESITRLNRLGIAIRSSSRSTVTARARRFASQRTDLARLSDYEEMALFAVDRLYPEAPESLRRQLADSMTDRYAKLKYELYRMEYHKDSLKKSTSQIPVTYAQGSRTATDELRTPLDDENKGHILLGQNEKAEPLRFNNLVSSIDPEVFEAVKSRTSPSISSKSMTVLTSCLKEPPLPKFESGETHTKCQFCFQMIGHSHVQKTESGGLVWSNEGRRHYRNDLQPYVCLSEECSESRPTYPFSGMWSHHMVSKHSENWAQTVHPIRAEAKRDASICPLCMPSYKLDHQLDNKHQPQGHTDEDSKERPSSSSSSRRLNTSEGQGNATTLTPITMAPHVAGHLFSLMNTSLNLMSGLDQIYCGEDGADSISGTIASSTSSCRTHHRAPSDKGRRSSLTFESPTVRPDITASNDVDSQDINMQDWTMVLETQRYPHLHHDTDSILDHFKSQQIEAHQYGDCYRCKIRELTCDERTPCASCIGDAAKIQGNNLAERICLRQQPTALFGVINIINRAELSSRSSASIRSYVDIFFAPYQSYSSSLAIPVFNIEAAQGERLQLDTDTLDEDMIVHWVSSQLQLQDNDFQSALDNIFIYCMKRTQPYVLTHCDLLEKVFRVRCFYKVWSQNSFLYRNPPESDLEQPLESGLEQLPFRVHAALKRGFANLIERIENAILSDLACKPSRQVTEQFTLWVCIMRVVLLYRDLITILSSRELQRKAEGLMNYAIILYSTIFPRDRPPALPSHDTYLLGLLVEAKHFQWEFLAELRRQDRQSDKVLIALLSHCLANYIFYCCYCSHGPWNLGLDTLCHSCLRSRCSSCEVHILPRY